MLVLLDPAIRGKRRFQNGTAFIHADQPGFHPTLLVLAQPKSVVSKSPKYKSYRVLLVLRQLTLGIHLSYLER
jgi:hypothetical protein